MKDFIDAPDGAAETGMPWRETRMTDARQSSGWRKATAGLAAAKRLARAGELATIPKSRAFVAAKRVGAYLGLKAGDMMLLDTLGAFTQAQDWGKGQRPIVWVSNAYLMQQTGFSLSALKRHTRRLAEIGVISFKDSPNGKRWGRRDTEGRIIEAYGIDLSPLAARAEEFEQLNAVLQIERKNFQCLKRQITVARRMIRASIEAALDGALTGPWVKLTKVFNDLLDRLPRRNTDSETLTQLLECFKELQERVEKMYSEVLSTHETLVSPERKNQNVKEMDPMGGVSGPHIPTTNQLGSVNCNRSENEQAAGMALNLLPAEQADGELKDGVGKTRKKRGIALDLSTVMQACPEFTTWARNMGGYLKDWGDLHRVAGQLRPMIGISEHAWNLAQERLGPQIATAALVLTFDKHCAGEVTSPGGYLRGIVQKAGAGELHLERSFFGRLSGQAA